jgi:hypothetical protein
LTNMLKEAGANVAALEYVKRLVSDVFRARESVPDNTL